MGAEDLLPDVAQRMAVLRRDLHAYPELAFEEQRTAAIVADHLQRLGLQVTTGVARTGVVATLRCGDSERAIGLRADMDALPLQEHNDFPHRSRHDGRMHACGHDGHVAMLLGAAEMLVAARDRGDFDGVVHFIFQPAEEGSGGARVMVEEGLFERWPMQGVYGLHNWPGLALGAIAVHQGAVMAGTACFAIHISGRGAHAAMPHQGRDVILAGAALTQNLQALVSRASDPLDAVVVSVTRFQAGHADNILPGEAHLGGTVRYFEAHVQDAIEEGMRRVAAGVAASHDVSIEIDWRPSYPPTHNDAAAAALCHLAAQHAVGENKVLTGLPPSMGAEDFSYFARVVPACYVWLGAGPGVGGCMLHGERYDFNDEIITSGVRYWLNVVAAALPPAPPTP